MSIYKHKRKMFRMDGKTLFVVYDDEGPIRILKRSIAFKGRPWEHVTDHSIWERCHHQPRYRTQPGSLTRRVLAQFQQEMNAHG